MRVAHRRLPMEFADEILAHLSARGVHFCLVFLICEGVIWCWRRQKGFSVLHVCCTVHAHSTPTLYCSYDRIFCLDCCRSIPVSEVALFQFALTPHILFVGNIIRSGLCLIEVLNLAVARACPGQLRLRHGIVSNSFRIYGSCDVTRLLFWSILFCGASGLSFFVLRMARAKAMPSVRSNGVYCSFGDIRSQYHVRAVHVFPRTIVPLIVSKGVLFMLTVVLLCALLLRIVVLLCAARVGGGERMAHAWCGTVCGHRVSDFANR